MSEPLPGSKLKCIGEPRGSILVVDPGNTCGIATVSPAPAPLNWLWRSNTCRLDELPDLLREALYEPMGRGSGIALVACEDFTLHGGNRRNAPKMPASQGIGMCRTACDWTDKPLFMIQPNCKTAGRKALDQRGAECREACRSEHARDAVDMAGWIFRQLRLPR